MNNIIEKLGIKYRTMTEASPYNLNNLIELIIFLEGFSPGIKDYEIYDKCLNDIQWATGKSWNEIKDLLG